MSVRSFVSVIVAAAALAGCATIIRGTEQQVSINTSPIGANVQFSNGQTCTAPCTIKSARNQSLMITVSKPGCNTQTATMMPTLAGGGVLLGGLIDYGTGAVYDLQPNPLNITLQCSPEGLAAPPAPQPGATATGSAAGGSVECLAPNGGKVLVGGNSCPPGWSPARG